jgi:hypothetical protein
MSSVFDTPPEDVATQLQLLRTVLDQELPTKVLDRNLLIATWNIREFSGLTSQVRRLAPSPTPSISTNT